LVISKHYRTEGNFSWDNLDHAQNRLSNWRRASELRWQPPIDDKPWLEAKTPLAKLPELLASDLATPQAVAEIDKLMGEANDKGITEQEKPLFENYLQQINQLLGIDLLESTQDITAQQKSLIDQRLDAKRSSDFQTADNLRQQLESEGINLNDTPNNTYWTRQS